MIEAPRDPVRSGALLMSAKPDPGLSLKLERNPLPSLTAPLSPSPPYGPAYENSIATLKAKAYLLYCNVGDFWTA